MRKSSFAAVAAAAFVVAGTASADIINVTGAFVEISPPASVLLGDLESNTEIFAFAEMLGIDLESLEVDITLPGFYDELADLTPGVIFPETPVDVFFAHADPVGAENFVQFIGSITFDQDILGVIVLTSNLDATDDGLGHPGTQYPTGLIRGRGMDFAGANFDFITLSEDRRTITVDWRARHSVDQIRIITAVPGPGGLVLLVGAGLVGVRRRRR